MTRFRLRRWWFQVHQWIGIALTVLIVPLSLSGAALVWPGALERLAHPQRFAITGERRLPPQAYVDAAQARLRPGERIAAMTMPVGGGPVIVVAAVSGVQDRTSLYLDPPTARVLEAASSAAAPVRLLHRLHGSLLMPGGGRAVVGWLGVAMLVSSVSGLWLWWPTVGRWTHGLRWRRRGDVNANLHHLLGFWVALPLALLSLTGAWLSFPRAFGALVGEAQAPARPNPAYASPVARTAVPIGHVVARAEAVAPGLVRAITWPTERKPDWSVQVGERTVLVADDSGVAVVAPQRVGEGGVAQLMRRVHDGQDMGPVWQAVIFAGGVLPAVLAVTGLVMWWRGRRPGR